MTFIYRLGTMLYWFGFAFAVLFAIAGALFVVSGQVSGVPIYDAWVFAVLSAVCWIWGRLMKFILTDT
jgi:hypothetical protein